MDKYVRRRVVDLAARRMVTAGGVFIIASILAMLVFLVSQVVPLWRSGRVVPVATRLTVPDTAAVSSFPICGSSEHQEVFFAVDRGARTVLWTPSARIVGVSTIDSLGRGEIATARSLDPSGEQWLAGTTDGRIVPIAFDAGLSYTEGRRTYEPVITVGRTINLPTRSPVYALTARASASETVVAALAGDREVWIARRTESRSLLGVSAISDSVIALPFPEGARPTAVALDEGALHLYLGTDTGQLLEWELADLGDRPRASYTAFRGSAITCAATLLGGGSIVLGAADGGVQVWFRALGAGRGNDLVRAHTFNPHRTAVAGIVSSPRNRTFVTWGTDGELAFRLATTGATRMRVPGGEALDQVTLTPKGDGVLASVGSSLRRWSIVDPHPEVSARSLFGRTHYEGYPRSGYVWQSTGGSDDAEPKLSLVPLMFGTLKGTFYAMCFSAPIAILAALYTAVFMRPRLRGVVKPVMELMATLPSVVLGLLAGLWLAPRLEALMPIVLASFVFIAIVVLVLGWVVRLLPLATSTWARPGIEVVVLVPLLACALGLLFRANGLADGLFEHGFLQWLYDRFDVRYDQRNAIVVGIAVGLAVMPIVFSVSEDSLSSVPRHLTAGSLALGATLWQTAWRVVLPAASPGIFSALMVGFGRAVGETMIMLMAAGNTPIMDFSLFNGLRTLSANITTEMPEAPRGGSLFRVLFLSALLLFGFTLIVNTSAELIRTSLRRRYSRF